MKQISAMELNGVRRVAAKALDEMRMFQATNDANQVGAADSQPADDSVDRNERLLRALQQRQRAAR